MATTNIFFDNNEPHFDDFDESKNFHRILFRPGHAVQARELTQMQTLLQAQIDRFGQYNFKDGSRVVDGKVTLNNEFDFIKVESEFTHSDNSVSDPQKTNENLNSFVGKIIQGDSNSVQARVLSVVQQSSGDPATLYVKYINSGGSGATANTIKTFVGGEEFRTTTGTVLYGKVKPNSDTPTGQGVVVNIEEGVYFIAGNFVYVQGQSLILDKYQTHNDYIVALKVTESIIDASTDTSLNDNASGTPNFAAPGAKRYKIATELIKQAITTADPAGLVTRADSNLGEASYVTLLVVRDGLAVIDETDKTLDTELTDRLARRTFEESGDYSVEPYQITVKEYLNDTTNNGFKTKEQIIADGDASDNAGAIAFGQNRLVVLVEGNTAYVKGHRVSTNIIRAVTVEKPRAASDRTTIANATASLPVGNFIKLTAGTVKGMPDVNTFGTIELHNATIATGQVSGSGSGNTQIGTARARALDVVSGELRLYLFDINMESGEVFNSVKSVKQAGTGQAFIGDLASVGNLFDVGNNGLVFKLPASAVFTLKTMSGETETSAYSIEYIVKQKFETTNNGVIEVNDTTNESFVNVSSITASLGTGAIDTTPQHGGTDGNTSLTFTDVGGSAPGSTRLKVMADVKVNLAPNSKTKTNGTLSAGGLTNGIRSLGKADIAELTQVLDAQSKDITNRFTLDNGQRDNFYDIGRIILKPGFPDPGNITVSFKYWEHGSGDYFTVNSYRNDSGNTPGTTYEEIPTFNSAYGPIKLRDAIDFRPRKANASDDFTSAGGTNPRAPKPNSATSSQLTHFMPRIDKLYVTRAGKYKIEKGIADENPKAPKVPNDSMGIYDLKLSPYIFSASELKPEIIDNRRYTMKDIGHLDKRIKNLEYYTSLSLLEQSAADVSIFDGQFSRTKNGFIVDGFRGHNIADVSNPDYAASIDKTNGLLRPKFDERNVNLVRKVGDNGNCVKNGSMVTMQMEDTDKVFVDQPYSSFASNVNPYNVFTWGGMIELSPDSDEWKETDVRPTIIIDDSSTYDQFVEMAEELGILGTVWNEWVTNWTGSEINERGMRDAGDEDFWWIDQGDVDNRAVAVTETEHQSRTGINTEVAFDTVERSTGSRVVEINFAPFIRSREINFKAQLMKPNTKVFPFFDGVDVSSFVRGETFSNSNPFEFSDQTNVVTHEGATSHPSTAGALTTDASGKLEGSFVIPRNDVLKFATGRREFRLSDSDTNNKSTETTFAESQYFAQGLIESIEETIISTKVPRLVQTELVEDREVETTTWVDPLAETFLVDKEGGIFVKSVDLFFKKIDTAIPVRVSIRSVENGIPTQKIVPGADKILYPTDIATQASTTVANFANANASTATNFAFDFPVYLPQDTEYAIVITSQCDNYEVFVAEMGGQDLTNTNFTIAKQPYGGVFFSSQNASTWTPEQSKDLKFKIHRASFKTGQTNEITFINDAVPVRALPANPFTTTSGSAVVTVNHPNHGMYESNSKVTLALSGSSDVNGISHANLEGDFDISNVTHNSYTITAKNADTATATGAGGDLTVTASENRLINVLYPVIENIQLPGTLITFTTRLINGTSVGSTTEASYSGAQSADAFPMLPNRNYFFRRPKLIASPVNEGNITDLDQGSIEIKATMTSTNEALSPVIDMNRLSLHTIQNIISDSGNATNGSASSNELSARGGSELSRYITRKVELAEEADSFTVLFNVNKPAGSDVKLFYRILEGGETGDINDKPFIHVTGDIPVNEIGFNEARFDIIESDLGNKSFSTIQFKLVLTSTSSSRVPRVRDFRAICTT